MAVANMDNLKNFPSVISGYGSARSGNIKRKLWCLQFSKKKPFFWKLQDTITSFWNFLTFSGKSSSLIHYAALTIIGNDECQEKHYDNLEASDSEIDRELRENVNLILVSEKKISSEIICTRAPIEDLGTCPGGYKIIHLE